MTTALRALLVGVVGFLCCNPHAKSAQPKPKQQIAPAAEPSAPARDTPGAAKESPESTIRALIRRLPKEKDAFHREEIVWAMGDQAHQGDQETAKEVIVFLSQIAKDDPDFGVRGVARSNLSEIALEKGIPDMAFPTLLKAVQADPDNNLETWGALSEMGRFLDHESLSKENRSSGFKAVGQLLRQHNDPRVRSLAADQLRIRKDLPKKSIEELRMALLDSVLGVRASAASTLLLAGLPVEKDAILRDLLKGARSVDSQVRLDASSGLKRLAVAGDTIALKELIRIFREDDSRTVRTSAGMGLAIVANHNQFAADELKKALDQETDRLVRFPIELMLKKPKKTPQRAGGTEN